MSLKRVIFFRVFLLLGLISAVGIYLPFSAMGTQSLIEEVK
ncbi:MAG: hypothetical protein QNK40_13210 [Desulfobacterales bacterium]|nr:hypothetical protein [Desulfobacterales bacterium]